MRIALFLAFILVYLAGCQKPQIIHTNMDAPAIPWHDSSQLHPMNRQYTDLLEKYRRKGLPGISLLVRDRQGTWIGSTGKADIINNHPFQPGTISKVASITKLMIATLVFKLMEDSSRWGIGYRALDKKICEWLPSRIVDRLPNGRSITLGQCMRHETGIPDVTEQNGFYLAILNNPNKKWQQEELLSYVYDMTPLFTAGDTAIYSSTNTILVSMVIEAQTGKNHSDLLRELIFRPLGMNDTYYQWHDELPSNVAQGYFDLYNNNTLINVSNLVTGSGNGYGGVFSNLYDLHRFAEALLLHRTLLQSESMNRMMSFGKTDGNNRYGYGVQKCFLDLGNDYGLGHKGRDLGYTANLFYFPSKGVLHIFFINYGTGPESELRQVFYDFQDELLRISLH